MPVSKEQVMEFREHILLESIKNTMPSELAAIAIQQYYDLRFFAFELGVHEGKKVGVSDLFKTVGN
jgi:hypothetical protein